jgi:predicted nucleic acid-binding protein
MILADSNIIIEYFRSRNSELSEKIDSLDVAVCGVIRTELLQGARNDKETDSLLEALNTFDTLPSDEYDWDGIGFMLQTMRSHGYILPLADAIIAYTAIKYDVPLWTGDKHFKFIQGLYPELKLYGG